MDSIIDRAHELEQPDAAGTKPEAEMSLKSWLKLRNQLMVEQLQPKHLLLK